MIDALLIDGVILLSLVVFIIVRTYRGNFIEEKTNLLAFSFGTLVALASYRQIATLLQHVIPFSRPILITLVFWLTLVLIDVLTRKLLTSTTSYGILFKDPPPKWQKYVLPLIVLIQGIVFVAFAITITVVLPLDKNFKQALRQSTIISFLSPQMTLLELAFREGFGATTDKAFDFLTTHPLRAHDRNADMAKEKPKANNLAVVEKLVPDIIAEKEMLTLVNKVRQAHNKEPLTLRQELVPIARDYAIRMWQGKFFGHVAPNGDDPKDRLEAAGIVYQFVGENLALSSNVTTAHIGLINSQEHLDNILDPSFHSIGIGVVENGSLGEIFVQIFTD